MWVRAMNSIPLFILLIVIIIYLIIKFTVWKFLRGLGKCCCSEADEKVRLNDPENPITVFKNFS